MRLIFLLMLFALPSFSTAQSSEVEVLEQEREKLKQEIQELQDSLLKVEEKITVIKSKEVLEKIGEKPILGIAKKGAYMTDEAGITGNVLFTIKEDTPIQVLDYRNRFYEVCINDKCGFMAAVWVKENEEMLSLKEVAKERNEREQLALEKEKKRKEYLKTQEQRKKEALASERASARKKAKNEEMEKKYGREVFNKMKQGKVWIGMNEEQALFAHGKLKDVNRSVGSWGVHEQWVYNGFNLYFENGKLTSWQD